MRLVLRYLLIEFSLAWAMVLAGFIRAGVQIWPFFANSLRAGLRRRRWRLCLGLLIGLPVVAGWPLLFSLAQARPGYEAWLQGMADPQPERRQTECRCGTCVARETRALSS
jgi:hypothetical protein